METKELKKLLRELKQEINGVHAPVGREYSNDQFKGYTLATMKQLKEDISEIKELQKEANKDFREDVKDLNDDIKDLNDFKAQGGVYILLGSTIVALIVTIGLKLVFGA